MQKWKQQIEFYTFPGKLIRSWSRVKATLPRALLKASIKLVFSWYSPHFCEHEFSKLDKAMHSSKHVRGKKIHILLWERVERAFSAQLCLHLLHRHTGWTQLTHGHKLATKLVASLENKQVVWTWHPLVLPHKTTVQVLCRTLAGSQCMNPCPHGKSQASLRRALKQRLKSGQPCSRAHVG